MNSTNGLPAEVGRFEARDPDTDAVVSEIFDRGRYADVQVMALLRAGAIVTYVIPVPDGPVWAPELTPIVEPVKPVANGTNGHKKAASAKPPPEPGSWSKGDHVYFAWSKLSILDKQELNTLMNVKGVVEAFRTGQGIRKTVGVRFNDDPVLVWVMPGSLSRIPTIDE